MSLTLDSLAGARGLDPAMLHGLGWRESRAGVEIPWPAEGGSRPRHVRHRLDKVGDGSRWTWQQYRAAHLLPFGAERLDAMRLQSPSVVVLSESEIDAVCLWVADIPALATGGAGGWQARWWSLIDGFDRVVVWLEDGGSVSLVRAVLATRPADAPPVAVCFSTDRTVKDAGRLTASRNGTAKTELHAIVDVSRPAELFDGDDLCAALTDRLEKVSGVRANGDRQACCPYHDDHDPSLSYGPRGYCCFATSCGAKGGLAFLAACLGVIVPESIVWDEDPPSDRHGAAGSPPGHAPDTSPFTTTHLADTIDAVPPLPSFAALVPDAEAAAAQARQCWLDPFILAAGSLSPRTPRAFLEACGLFALMTAVARRTYVQAGAIRLYPALFLLFVGRSTTRAKTTALSALRLLIREAGLSDLLLPASFTPQALLTDLALHVPAPIRDGSEREQTRWLERHRHGAARAVIRDEAAGLLEDTTKDYNNGLLPLLLQLDGAPDEIDPDLTISRGLLIVENVCINFVGGTTPAALRDHVARPYHWHNGLWARFGLVGPDEPPRWAFWGTIDGFPPTVVQGLRALYDAFPRPSVVFEYGEAKGEKVPPRIVGAVQVGYGALPARVQPEVRAAWEAYDRALHTLAARPEHPERLDATYGRLSSTAIRIALTLAAIEWALADARAGNQPVVRIGHWAAAQQIAERWRTDAHAILAAALRDEGYESATTDAERLGQLLTRQDRMLRGVVLQTLHWTAARLDAAIVAATGRVMAKEEKSGGRPRIWLSVASDAGPVPDEGTDTNGTSGWEEGEW
ncbi:MAG: DUF3987 domain-containing protein [Chloroflexi bacterium]|nr:DUF3987 domain-containing protein [Chloroflexota bacterium]